MASRFDAAHIEVDAVLDGFTFVHVSPDSDARDRARAAFLECLRVNARPSTLYDHWADRGRFVAVGAGQGVDHAPLVVVEDPSKMPAWARRECDAIAAEVDGRGPVVVRFGTP